MLGAIPLAGSRLLSAMLDSHRRVLCGPETNLLCHGGIWTERFNEVMAKVLSGLSLIHI